MNNFEEEKESKYAMCTQLSSQKISITQLELTN